MLVALLYKSSIAWFSALPCWYAICIYVRRSVITFNSESFRGMEESNPLFFYGLGPNTDTNSFREEPVIFFNRKLKKSPEVKSHTSVLNT